MKALSIALRVIAILGVAAAAYFWQSTKGVVAEKETEIQQLTTQKADISKLNEELTAEKEGLKGQLNQKDLELSEQKSQVRFANDQVSKLKRDLGKAERDLSDKDEEFVAMKSDFDQLKRDVADMEKARVTDTASVSPEVIKDYEAQIERLEEEKGKLKDDLALANKRLQDGALGAPIAGAPGADEGVAMAPVPEQEASILRTDKEKGILIISRGQADGLQRQMEFNIAKGLGRKVRVQVGTVTPTYSVAYVLPGQDPSEIQQGDAVMITAQ